MRALYLVLIISIVFLSCKKSSNGPASDNTLIVSPQFLLSILGKNWNDVEPIVTSKRGYLYSAITTDPGFIAAITLPAYDTSYGKKTNCTLLLNVTKAQNHVTAVSMNTNDSLSPLSKQEAYNLQSYYYTNGLKGIQDTTDTQCFYDDGQTEVHVPLEDLLSKLNTYYETSFLGILYQAPYLNITIECYQTPGSERRTFSFIGYGN